MTDEQACPLEDSDLDAIPAYADDARRRLGQIEALRDDRECLQLRVAHLEAEVRLLRAVERDALARLEAWRADDQHRGYCLTFDAVILTGLATADRVVKRRFAFSSGERADLVVGTDDAPATLAEVIHAALDEWERCAAEKGEG